MKKLLIVGGGSAGWMTAAYLNGALNSQGSIQNIAITLLESPDIPRISVGEATIPSMRHLLSVVGIKEHEFMRATDASFKQSIKYQNWVKNDGSFYHHPFTSIRETPLDRSGSNWLASDQTIPFIETCSIQPTACEAGLAPATAGQWTLPYRLNYAFHMNAQKFADLLRDFSIAKGVRHSLANLKSVELNEAGWLTSVKTDRRESLEADFFIDCTGFKGHLINETLDVEFESYSQYLLCDRAVTMHLPYDKFYPGTVRPYTTATALSSGWVWDIPMQNQRSIGYVHSSHFINKNQAEAELREYQGPGTEDIGVRFVDFKVGKRKALWQANCVAIGLAGGFIEPLESTGLYLSDLGAVLLAEHWPRDRQSVPILASRYNRLMSNRYYEILDFINMHYCLSQRVDTSFWREVQKPERINPRLQAKLNMWKTKPPTTHDFEDQWFKGMELIKNEYDLTMLENKPPVDTGGLWNHESYECILYGMHYLKEETKNWYGEQRPKARLSPQVAKFLRSLSQLPDHAQWLQSAVGMHAYHPSDPPVGWSK